MIARFLKFTVIFITIIILPIETYACTSFAVFSGSTLFGMNFDFADAVMKFLITSNGNFRTFHLAFERVFGDASIFVKTAGMNTKGLFSSCQEMYTDKDLPNEYEPGSLYIFQLYEQIDNLKSVKEVEEVAIKSRLINLPDLNLHNIFADTDSLAIVTEAGEESNEITHIEDKFMIMTNFPNCSLKGKSYRDAKGKGDERFILCHEYIEENFDSFNIKNALTLLRRTCNKDPMFPTSCSMVFSPEENEIFLVLFRDFERVYKVSIESGIIDMVDGKDKSPIKIPEGDTGIMAEDIKKHFR